MVPIIVPEIVLAVAMLIIFMTVGIRLGMGTILIGHCTFCIPYAVVTIKEGRITGDSETLQEASMDLGANRFQTFWRVTVPSIMPGILSSAFLAFTLSIDDVVMSNMLAGPSQSTLPVLILSLNRTGITPDVNALTTVMVALMVAGMLALNGVQRYLKKRENRACRRGGSQTLIRARRLTGPAGGGRYVIICRREQQNEKALTLILGAHACAIPVCLAAEETPSPPGSGNEPSAASSELNIFMWGDYISETLISDFEKANNCTVNLSYMSDNADSITKLTGRRRRQL